MLAGSAWQRDGMTNTTVLQPPHLPIPTCPTPNPQPLPPYPQPPRARPCVSAAPVLPPRSQSLLSHLPASQPHPPSAPTSPRPQTPHPCIPTDFTNLTPSPLCPRRPRHLRSISQPHGVPSALNYTLTPITQPHLPFPRPLTPPEVLVTPLPHCVPVLFPTSPCSQGWLWGWLLLSTYPCQP